MAEFKISRLRYSWAGPWASQRFYNKDEVVQFEGKAYVCLVPHTSNSFQQELDAVEPKWELMMTGQTWRGVWTPSTLYSLDNIIIFGGIVYKCNAPHVSGVVLDTDAEKWDIYAESKTWQSEWTSSTTYGVGAIVQYGSSVYECIVSHISAPSDLDGLEADYNPEDSTVSKWKILKEGFSWKGEYATSTEDSSQLRYKLNDIVRYGPSLYRCIVGHAPVVEFQNFNDSTLLTATFIEEYWVEWLPGLDFNGVWNSETIYQPGDIALYGGYLYANKRINNLNIVPSFNAQDSTDAWVIVVEAFEIQGAWSPDEEYKVGTVITYGGDVYVAIVDNAGEVPGNREITTNYQATGSSGKTIKVTSTAGLKTGMTVIGEGFARGQYVVTVADATTVVLNEQPDGVITNNSQLLFAGVNGLFWELLIPGFNWEGRWNLSKLYNQDDVVYWGNATYKCIREHTSSLISRPDNDLTNQYWVVYLQHFRGNFLNNTGEIITFDFDGPVALPIGDQSTVLKVIEGLPKWSDLEFTPAVFYVATNGVDTPAGGTTFDTAWRTIKYACERVKDGALNPNARVLLRNNRKFIAQETFYWFKNQRLLNAQPFNQFSTIDEDKTLRDINYIIDAVIFDVISGGNSQIVASTLYYFDLESTNRFTNKQVEDQILTYIVTLIQLFINIEYALTNTVPPINYQTLLNVQEPELQYFNNALELEDGVLTFVQALEGIIITALSNGSPVGVPPANQRLTTTINVKSGTYDEILPIVLPANSALNGDELRGAVVRPANPVNTLCTRTIGFLNQFVVGSTVNMENNTPVQFVSLNPVVETSTIIGGVEQGKTYYVIGSSITDTTFQISEEPNGEPVVLSTNIGFMYVYGGNALSDMFYVQNGTGIRNMTCTGLLGTLTAENEFLTRRPTGGTYVSLDPGEGPEDTSAWIIRKSPYIQNVTNFGLGCVGLKIDSTLHNGGNRSIVCNDYTQILSDGIGIWCTGGDALCEAVSVFSYYNYAGYFAEDGGRIRATNGNSSYGTYGVIAEGFDPEETPAIGAVNNRSNQASASAVSALGANAEILKIQYNHAGTNYKDQTINLLVQSNNLLSNEWLTDNNNINITKSSSTPFEGQDAWRVQANTSLSNSSYFYQTIEVAPQGKTYVNVSGTNETGSGTGATFNVTVFSNFYLVAVNDGGSGYVVGNQIRIPGTTFGGRLGINDIVVTVESLAITSILTIIHQGEVPKGSALPYTLSIYAKQGTAQYFDFYAIFTGYDLRSSFVRYNFATGEITTNPTGNFGITPTDIYRGVDLLEDGWVRVWFTIWDETAQNDQLEFRVYPRGIDGLSGITNFYGAQLQKSEKLTFYLDTKDDRFTSFADINVQGAGKDVRILGNELRSNSIFQVRVLEDSNLSIGGLGYRTQTNNAQGGSNEFLTLAQSEVAQASEYEGMKIVISSGRGAGQFGAISRYNPITKNAFVLKESFDALEVVSADSSTNRFTLNQNSDFNTVYLGQKLQFVPTFYDVDVTSTSQNSVVVTSTEGNLNNIMTVASTARLRVNMPVNFSGEIFGGVISNFTYFIIDIIDGTRIQLASSSGGAIQPLTTEVGEMILNYPSNTSFLFAETTDNMEVTFAIKFTGNSLGGVVLGNTYYIHDIYNDNQFSISSSKITVPVTATTQSNNSITTDNTSVLIPLNAILFQGTTIGNLEEKKRYYIRSIIDGTRFTVSDNVITRSAITTQAVTNLVTVDSTSGFLPNSPIIFVGTTFGNIINNKVYYIQVVNNATSFTISESPGGAAFTLTNATGEVIVRTLGNTIQQIDSTGSMLGLSTGEKETVGPGSGIMEASFFTETFGGITQGTTYFVLDKFEGESKEFTITTDFSAPSPTVVPLLSETGSMQIGEVGWDNINAGSPISTVYDSTTVYTIEPRLTFSEPPTVVEQMGTIPDAQTDYISIASNGFLAIAVPEFGDQVLVTDFQSWSSNITLPFAADDTPEGNGGWIDSAYGNGTWVLISKKGKSLYSVSDGLSWMTTNLPNPGTAEWASIAYGNGRFVAVCKDSNLTAYTVNDGLTWTAVNDSFGSLDWIDIAYGKKTFVAIASSSNTIKYSTDGGETWQASSLGDSSTTQWASVKFGNGRFVAVSKADRTSVYSFDGITWFQTNLAVSADFLEYGQGAFLAVKKDEAIAYVSPDGINWRQKTIVAEDYTCLGFSFDIQGTNGWFLIISSTGNTYKVSAGCKTLARALVDNQRIVAVSLLEPGAGYIGESSPTVKIVDPNNSIEAKLNLRVGSGTLGSPTISNQGSGYNTASTAIYINGSGFADEFQPGQRIICKGLTRLPRPGDNLQFTGNSRTYRVANAIILRGTVAPNLEAEIRLSPSISQDDAPEHDTSFNLRSRFSQVRLTNHDYLNIGFGNEIQSNYPKLPINTGLEPQDEVQETNNGRVFYSSTDQDGNFRVGDLFAVEQATGIVTLNASDFGLEGLTELAIGGVALGGSPVIITEFSTDGTFVANSNNIVPTQRAIRTYLASRLSQGGSNTFTGQLIAGTVRVGGPDEIDSTVTEGAEGWRIKIPVKANISGPTAAWAGDGLAMAYFMKTLIDPTRNGFE